METRWENGADDRIPQIACESCGARMDVGEAVRTTVCPHCASPYVIERPAAPGRPSPGFVVPFVVPRDAATAEARRWLRRWRLLAPSRFRRAKIASIRGVYVPAYLYSGEVHVRYTARIGEDYVEIDTSRSSRKGTLTERKTEWRRLRGTYATYVQDVVVSASKGLSNADLEAIEPFDLRVLHRYAPALLSGWYAEEASVPPETCRETARKEVLARLERDIVGFLPGDRQRDVQYEVDLVHEDLELVLLPVWILPVRYRDDRPPVRLLVNGQTGRTHGRAPVSPARAAAAVAFVLAVVVLLLLLARGGAP